MKKKNFIELNKSKFIKKTIICIHGLGGDKKNFIPIIKNTKIYKNKNIRFIFLQSPKIPITANNNIIMNAWYNILLKKNLFIEDKYRIKQSQINIKYFIDREIKRGIKAKNIFLIGFDQGAVMSLHTGLKYPQKLAGLISLSGYLPFKNNFFFKKNNFKPPIFIGHGLKDNIINIKYALKLKNILNKNNYTSILKIYNIKHEICKKEISNMNDWIIKKI